MELTEERLESWKEELEIHREEIIMFKKRYWGLIIFISIVGIIAAVLGGKDLVSNLGFIFLGFLIYLVWIDTEMINNFQTKHYLSSQLQVKLLEEIIITLRDIKYNKNLNR